MKKWRIVFLVFFLIPGFNQAQTGSISVKTWIPQKLNKGFQSSGRIFLFVSDQPGEQPRLNTWPNKSNMIFAINLKNWNLENSFTFSAETDLDKTTDISLDKLPVGTYQVQVLWKQNKNESEINAPGNLYSENVMVDLSENRSLELPLKFKTKAKKLAKHPLLKEVNLKSPVLSEFRGKEIHLKAAVLLPSGFFDNPKKKYPVRYNIAGYGGRHTRANWLVNKKNPFIDWWDSKDAPQIINVFLDSEGPFGDCYQLDSENNGPYGTALIDELIPYIENHFRGIGKPESRFLDGCSTGGWVSLALQLFYPDYFGGCFSYSPDPVDFENFQLINIYQDKNAFFNEYGNLRPLARNLTGEPVVSQKEFIDYENTLGWNGTYITSGGQFSAFTALNSPKGKDGLPEPLFDPHTGEINPEIAKSWRKHDLKSYVKNNWETLGPKIQGKIWIWMGDMDNYYLNTSLHAFEKMMQQMSNPHPEISIHFSPMEGHCSQYDHRKVLMQISEKSLVHY